MKLTADTLLEDAMTAIPGAKRALFAKYHIGGCSSCAYHPGETLAELCARNENLPVGEVIEHLEKSAEQDARILLEPVDLAALLAGENPPELLDVRTREEFEHVRIEGARLFTQELNQEVMGSWDKDRPVVYVDHKGDKALDAAAFLIGHGYVAVRSLRGGIDAYSREVDSSLKRYRLEMDA